MDGTFMYDYRMIVVESAGRYKTCFVGSLSKAFANPTPTPSNSMLTNDTPWNNLRRVSPLGALCLYSEFGALNISARRQQQLSLRLIATGQSHPLVPRPR